MVCLCVVKLSSTLKFCFCFTMHFFMEYFLSICKNANSSHLQHFMEVRHWIPSHSLPLAASTDQRRKQANMWQRKASTTSVFILQLKPTGYIYPGQTCQAQRRVKPKRRIHLKD